MSFISLLRRATPVSSVLMSIDRVTLDAAGFAGSATMLPLTAPVFPSKLSYVSSAWNSAVLFFTSYVFDCANSAGATMSAAAAIQRLMFARTRRAQARFRRGATLCERKTDEERRRGRRDR